MQERLEEKDKVLEKALGDLDWCKEKEKRLEESLVRKNRKSFFNSQYHIAVLKQ